MSLFQNSVIKKQIIANADKISEAYKLYADYFHNPTVQENIRNSKEEQFQEGFLRELFVKNFGYTLNPAPNYNLITEQRKQRITLTLKQQDEWEEYFSDYKTECSSLSVQISATDKEIDRMVYTLYGLSVEEIEIIEK